MPDLVREPSTGSSVRRPSFFQSTSADLLITVTREGRQFVWSPACLAWLRMEQPLINASTVNVLVSGPVSVTGQVSVLGNVSVAPAALTSWNVAGNVSADVTDRIARILGVVASLGGNVSVQGNVSVSPAALSSFNIVGNVSADVTNRAGRVLGDVSVPAGVFVEPGRSALDTSPATRASVGSANTLVLQANASRTGLFIGNPTAITVYLGVSSPASLGAGMFLAPNGVWNMGVFDFTRACINAIASVGAIASVAIQEFV